MCGFAAEVAAVLAEKAIFDLRGPVLRVTGYDVPYPYWQIEDAYMPSVARVLDAVRRLLAFYRPALPIVTERLVLRCREPRDAPLFKDALDSISIISARGCRGPRQPQWLEER